MTSLAPAGRRRARLGACLVVLCAVLPTAVGACCSKKVTRTVEVSGPNALLEGFDVPRFSLTKGTDEQGLPNVEWRAPEDATLVRCALFWCEPQFETLECERDYPGSSLRTISNYDDCVLAHEDTPGPSGALTLSSFDLTELKGRIPDGVRAGTSPRFAVGCWSFSKADVNGASLLVPFFPSEVGSFSNLGVSPDCSDKKAGGPEFLCEVGVKGAPPAAIGWCRANGECSPLCAECSECLELASITGAAYASCSSVEAGVKVCGGARKPDSTCVDAE